MASTDHHHGLLQWPRSLMAMTVLAAILTPACTIGRHAPTPGVSSPPPASTAPVSPPISSGPQTSGSRTVLSPIGLRVRQAPSRSARVLGAAAQGVTLTVLGYTSAGGGWFKVKGATVTGWISAQPTLSAPGEFQSYSAAQFSALYPTTWTEAARPGSPSSVVFRPASGPGDIVVTTAGKISQLPHGRPGYSVLSVSQVVACGITAGLVVLQQTGTSPVAASSTSEPESLTYLAEVRFAVDKQQALGLYADLPDLGFTLQIFKEFVVSTTFSAPQCVG